MIRPIAESKLETFLADRIWIKAYPVRYFGCGFDARMTIVRLASGDLLLHSPCAIDEALRDEARARPRRLHHRAGHLPHSPRRLGPGRVPRRGDLHLSGIERKDRAIRHDGLLGDVRHADWADDLDQVVIRGNRWISEVAFIPSRERDPAAGRYSGEFTDATPHATWKIGAWFKLVFGMWNRPKPAPEYQLGWRDKRAARDALERVLAFDVRRVIMAHGELIESDALTVLRRAWTPPLGIEVGRSGAIAQRDGRA